DMNRKISSLIMCLVLLLSLSLTAFAVRSSDAPPLLVDNANLLTSSEKQELSQLLEKISNNNNFDVVVVTVNSTDGKTPEAYADDYYDYNHYGQGTSKDGCLLLLDMGNRKWHISTAGYGITVITDYGKDVIGDIITPYLSGGSYYTAFSKFANTVDEFTNEALKGTPYDTNHKYANDNTYNYNNDYNTNTKKSFDIADETILIALVVSVVIALIVVFSIRSKYKPVRFKPNASDYLVRDSLNVKQGYERFLYASVSKTARNDESSSGGGSSTHTSSSGTTHGGGGGNF
nr:TPM domain-containing protein [Clostridiales bacterium]